MTDDQETVWERARKAGIFLPWVGKTGGTALTLGKGRGVPVAELKARHEDWFPRFMGRTTEGGRT